MNITIREQKNINVLKGIVPHICFNRFDLAYECVGGKYLK